MTELVEPGRLRQKWEAGQQISWVLLDLVSFDLVEIIGRVGFDALMIEGEHAPLNEETVLSICRICELTGMTPVIRLRTIRSDQITRLLDTGIKGVHLTHVRSREQAEHLVRCVRYPPVGERGFGTFSRINRYGLYDEAEDVSRGSREVLVSVCIEDIEGAENIEEICQAEGVDAIAIGRSDLAASMGIPGAYDDPRFKRVLENVQAVIANSRFAGKPLFSPEHSIATTANKFIAESFRSLLQRRTGSEI